MPAVQRMGDTNSKGGMVTSGIGSVLVNGRPVAVPSRSVTPHPPCSKKRPLHCIARTSGGASTVRVAGQPVLIAGNKDTCGCGRSGGSPNVRAV